MRGRFLRERAMAMTLTVLGLDRNPPDPQPDMSDPALDQWVADVLHGRNDGTVVPPPLP